MKKIISTAFVILFVMCIESGLFMLIAHWWGMQVTIAVIAVEFVFILWTVYELRRAVDGPEK